MATMRDKPAFRQFGYWPNTPSQWREPTVDDCTWYAGEFAFEAADRLHRNFHPVNDIRSGSSDTQGGTEVQVMLRDMKKFWPKDGDLDYVYGGYTKPEIKRALNTGATVVVGGDYEELPVHYRRWTNNDLFNHAVAVRFLHDTKNGDTTAMYDPLGGGYARAPYDGEWIGFGKFFGDYDTYAWHKSHTQYWVGIVDSLRSDAIVRQLYIDADDVLKEARVEKGTPIFARPTTVSPVIKKYWDDTKYYRVAGKVNANWYAMFYWSKTDKSQNIGYVAAQDIQDFRNREPEVFESNNERITALESANQALVVENKGLIARLDAAAAAIPPLVDAIGGTEAERE